jgi:hypothetical protein
MDMFDGVGRRLDQTSGTLVSIGANSLNGRERKILWRQNGDGTFTDVAFVNAADRSEDGRGLSIFDYDRDGRLDLLIRNFRQPAQLLRNVGAAGHWIEMKLVGTRSNRDAVGAVVRLRTGERWQTRMVSAGSGYLSSSSLVVHFGLGDATVADEVLVRWPSGGETRLEDLDANRRYRIAEGGGPEELPLRTAGR